MNVNGSKYHLARQREDWDRWTSPREGVTLCKIFEKPERFPDATIEWNKRERNLRLARQLVQFRSAGDQPPTSLDNRRGSGRDRYGHWYWIDEAQTGIRFLARGETKPVTFWTSTTVDTCEPPQVTGVFAPVAPPLAEPVHLSGLAVTGGHYLVAGIIDRGLLIFDLHRGGPPVLLLWNPPEGERFLPWDMAPTPDGGLLILSREGACYWRLNHHFQLTTTLSGPDAPPPEATFQPEDPPADAGPRCIRPMPPVSGYTLVGGAGHAPPAAPVSIESGPGGSVLILDAPAGDPAMVYEYRDETLRAVYDLAYSVSDPETGTERRAAQAHDFAYVALSGEAAAAMPLQVVEQADDDEILHLLFVARRDGNQVIVYRLRPVTMGIDAQPDYLPLRRWQERGLVAAGDLVYYDFDDRWIPLGVFIDCEYATAAIIESPANFERRYRAGSTPDPANLLNGLPEQPFDSNIEACLWHRLFLDAEIPAGTQVAIEARAADEPESLTLAAWQAQPRPYLRSGGAELPYYDPYAARRGDPSLGERAGTWEILLQSVRGRYIQLRLTLLGTGRATPEIQALRLWYPRFSYKDQYLPAIYSEDPVSAGFSERLLANFEGLYTDLEEQIVHVTRMFDPRTAPSDSLAWLADWLGVVLHPLWDETRRRFFIRFAHRLYTMRGTLRGLVVALRIFLDDEVDDTLFDRECQLRSRVRIVEHFLTRNVAGRVVGDPEGATATESSVAASAHRFSVLLPHRLEDNTATTSDTRRMVERIVELEKPAHTWFDIKEYWAMFRVGEARLGLDTSIGHASYFQPLVLGDAILPNATLGCPYPLNVQDRFVMGRNRVR